MRALTISWKNCFKVGLSIFILYLAIKYLDKATAVVSSLLGALSPLFIGCIIAYLVNILMTFYEKYYFPHSKASAVKKSKRPVCMLLAFLTLIAIIVLVISLVIPQLILCLKLMFSGLPAVFGNIMDKISELKILPNDISVALSEINWQERIGRIIGTLMSGMGNIVDIVIKTVSAVFSSIVTAILSVIFAVYLLLSKDNLKRQLIKLKNHFIPYTIGMKFQYIISVFDEAFHSYIVGQCIEAVILGCLCIIGMLILQLPYAVMIGVLIAFTALIPIAGAYIGAGVGAIMIFAVSPIQALVFLIFIVILQQIEGNIIYPKVVGSSIGLPGIWVLAAVTAGGGFMGVLGMFIGVPIAAAIYRLLKETVNTKKNQSKKL